MFECCSFHEGGNFLLYLALDDLFLPVTILRSMSQVEIEIEQMQSHIKTTKLKIMI